MIISGRERVHLPEQQPVAGRLSRSQVSLELWRKSLTMLPIVSTFSCSTSEEGLPKLGTSCGEMASVFTAQCTAVMRGRTKVGKLADLSLINCQRSRLSTVVLYDWFGHSVEDTGQTIDLCELLKVCASESSSLGVRSACVHFVEADPVENSCICVHVLRDAAYICTPHHTRSTFTLSDWLAQVAWLRSLTQGGVPLIRCPSPF